jgi:hypothetical protein
MKKISVLVFFAVLFLSSIAYAEEDSSYYPEIIRLPGENETGMDGGVRWNSHKLSKSDTPASLFGDLAEDAMRFNRLDARFWKEGVVIRKPKITSQIKNWTPMPETFAKCESRMGKCVAVSLADQFLGIYVKGKLHSSYPVSTGMIEMECEGREGKKSCRTPAVETYVGGRYFKTFSYRYRVWMWFALDIGHGRFLHSGNLVGRPDSHGCIRMFRRDARKVYNFIRIGTKVFVEHDINKAG